MKAMFGLLMIALVILLILTLGNSNKLSRNPNYAIDTQMVDAVHSELKGAVNALGQTPQQLTVAGQDLAQAGNNLNFLLDSLTEQGVPNVANVLLQLQNVTADFENSSSVSAEQLYKDQQWVASLSKAVDVLGYPKGKLDMSGLSAAFAKISTETQ